VKESWWHTEKDASPNTKVDWGSGSPGFMVMNAPTVDLSATSSPSIVTDDAPARRPSHTALNCTAHTDSTSGTSRLNSS
jgi:hypothetical protein